MDTVIFDLDGTLAETSGDLIVAANACFREMGFGDVLDMERDKTIAHGGGRRMLSEGLTRLGRFDAAVVDAYYPVLLEAYGAAIDVHTVLYPGVVEVIEGLRSDGHGVGVCTNKPEALAEQLLQSLGVRSAFDALIGADTLPVRKPDPAPLREAVRRAGGDMARACLIGDTRTDRDTARAAGVPCVLVTFGPDGHEVEALAPEALLDDYADLRDVLRTLW